MKEVLRVKLTLLGALGALAIIPAAAPAQLAGASMSWQYYAYGGPYSGGTSSGSFVVTPGILGTFAIPSSGIVYFDIYADNTSITFDYSRTSAPGTWSGSSLSLAPTIYNGIGLNVNAGPTLTSVTIDPSTNMAGFNASDLSFTGNQIEVNWANLSWDSNTIVKLDVNSVPEPFTIALCAGGLGLAIARRRKAKKS